MTGSVASLGAGGADGKGGSPAPLEMMDLLGPSVPEAACSQARVEPPVAWSTQAL